MPYYPFNLGFFIKKIKKEKILITLNLNQSKKFFNIIVKFLIKKNILKIEKNSKMLSKKYFTREWENFFFKGRFHQEVFFQENKVYRNFIFETLEYHLKMKKFSNSDQKVLIIFHGIENLTTFEQGKLNFLVHKMKKNYWIVLNFYKKDKISQIFDDFYFFPLNLVSKELKRGKKEIFRKKSTKILVKKDLNRIPSLWEKKVFKFFFFATFKNKLHQRKIWKLLESFFYRFIFFPIYQKILKGEYTEKEKIMEKKTQEAIFFYDEMYHAKNLKFENQKN